MGTCNSLGVCLYCVSRKNQLMMGAIFLMDIAYIGQIAHNKRLIAHSGEGISAGKIIVH